MCKKKQIEELKDISFQGRNLKYKVVKKYDFEFNYLTSVHTIFYEGFEEKFYKKYKFFGKLISYNEPKKIMKIDIDIEDPLNSKNLIQSELIKAFKEHLAVENRMKEIKNGEIL